MSERVCAVVVTYSRKELLRECLLALQSQERPVDSVLVVDNASTDGTLEMLRDEFAWCWVLPLENNMGGAGGFSEGMKRACEDGFDWLWLMDDDGRPAPDCLQKLMAQTAPDRVVVPLQKNKLGYSYGVTIWNGNAVEVTADILAGKRPTSGDYMFSFVGPLLPRTLVEKIGLPHAHFFIYFDDWEYSLRIHEQSGAEIRIVPDALFYHDIGGHARNAKLLWYKSVRVTPAPWKLYYGARNAVWTLAHGNRPRRELRKYLSYHLRWMIGDILYESDRWQRIGMRGRGIRDGLLNRMGKRI